MAKEKEKPERCPVCKTLYPENSSRCNKCAVAAVASGK